MALTTRTNGSGSTNIIDSSWWNDYKNLLTGTMTDQPVDIANSVKLIAPAAPGSAPSGSTSTSSANLSVGAYQYCFTYANADGAESPPSATLSISTTSGHQQINLTSISTGPSGTTKRNVYRTQVGGSAFFLLTTLNNNTTTSFNDNIADGSLTSNMPQVLAGGGLILASNGGTQQGYIGSSSINSGTVRIHGNGRVELSYNGAEPSKLLYYDTNGLHFCPGLAVSQSVLIVGNSLGIKNASGTKLAEVRNSGNFIISGTQYQTSAGSIATAASSTFDSFDFAETFEVDRAYTPGTVLCPADTDSEIPLVTHPGAHRNQPLLTQCTHDLCSLAMVSVSNPGFLAGLINLPGEEGYDEKQPLTMACAISGRIFAKTAYHIAGRSYICSDGRGGVRSMHRGEKGMALGVALGPTVTGKVPFLIRPTFVCL